MCAAPALHAVRSELLGEGGLCVRPVHSPVPAFLFLARPRADPSGAAARVAGRVPSSGSTAPTGVAAVVVVTVAALPWCDGGVEHRRPAGAPRGSPAVLSRRLGGLEPARASVGPTRRRAEQRCDTACEPRSSRPPGRLLIRTPTTATERFGWFSTSPRASEKRIDAAS